MRAATRTRRQKLCRYRDGGDIFIGDDERFFAVPAVARTAWPASVPATSRCDPGGGRHRCRPVDHQAAARPAEDHLPARVRASTRSRTRAIGWRSAPRSPTAEADAASRAPSIPISAKLLRRLGSKQVRAAGTVGGNIANGSPIGDMPPALIALGADDRAAPRRARPAHCRSRISSSPTASRTAGPANFWSASWCRSSPLNEAFRCYKIAKRFDQDISARHGRLSSDA